MQPPSSERTETPGVATTGPPPSPYNRNVVALGLTSLFTDVGTEMIVPVLPLFITVSLGAPVAVLGIIEGAAESAASLLRLGSGWLSDHSGRRKPFLVFGYGLSTVAKGMFAFPASWPALMGLRLADRLGKGLRNPPRDALIADSVLPDQRGRAFGLHRALDTLGAAIGPLVAFAMLAAWPGDYRRIFAASVIPGALSLITLVWFVRSVRHVPTQGRPLAATLRGLGSPFRRFVIADTVFQLGNSSMAFVLLRAKSGGMLDGFLPLAYVLYNVVAAALALPLGALSDRIGRRRLILAGYALFAGVYALLAYSGSPAFVVTALALLGVHAGLLSGAQRSLIADLVPADRRATAYGVHHTAVGLALLPASALAGWLWDVRGPRMAFVTDAVLAGLAALLFVLLLPARRERQDRRHDATG
ncbi:MAG: MFS transporter [Candidatus Eisenbacteria bacterium]